MGRGIPLPIPSPFDYGGAGPGRKWILCIFRSTEHIFDRQKLQNDQLHFDQLLELQRILTLNRTNSGQGSEFGTIQCPE